MNKIAIPIENRQLKSVIYALKEGKKPLSNLRIKLGNKPYQLIFRDGNNLIRDWFSLFDLKVQEDIRSMFSTNKERYEGRIQIFIGLNPNYELVEKNDRIFLVVNINNGIST